MGQSASAKMIYKLSEEYYVRSLGWMILRPYPSWFSNQDVCKFNSHGNFSNKSLVRNVYQKYRSWYFTCVGNLPHRRWSYREYEFTRINIIDRTAELAVLIGESSHWGKGVETQRKRLFTMVSKWVSIRYMWDSGNKSRNAKTCYITGNARRMNKERALVSRRKTSRLNRIWYY